MSPDSADPRQQTTRLLRQMSEGDPEAAERLLPFVLAELRRLAGRMMEGERADHTLQATALVNEAYMRLIGHPEQEWQGRAHFVRVAARAMRNILVDHARARRAQKRGADRARVTLDEKLVVEGLDPESLLAVDETLSRLSTMDPQLGQIVEMRFFGGLSDPEIAEAMDMSLRSVQRAWRTARAWLARAMAIEKDQEEKA